MEYYSVMKNYLSDPWQKIHVIMSTSDKIRNYIYDVINYLKTLHMGKKTKKISTVFSLVCT